MKQHVEFGDQSQTAYGVKVRPSFHLFTVFPSLLIKFVLAVLFLNVCASVARAQQAEDPVDGADREADHRLIQKINLEIKNGWADYEILPSKLEDDGKWARRLFLDMIGRIPKVEELDEFLADKDKNKREKLVDKLLYDDQYTLDYARHWTTVWSNILIGRTGGNQRRSLINREGMQKYLRDSFARNKPYNEIVGDLITATGTTKPGEYNFNGATNFLVDKVNQEDATQATAAVSRVFLGLQIQCTQCHNHPFNDWKQEKYWEFNAFFRQARALRRFQEGTRNIDYAELIDQDYGGQSNNPEQADLFYELRNGLVKVAFPTFVDGQKIKESGLVREVVRRKELSKFVLDSSYMDKAIVNRMWGHFFGTGFVRPIDDLGPHNTPSHPELLESLSKQFRESGYDQKKLIRWIVLSEAYGLSSRANKSNEKDDPALGRAPVFSHYYIRPMNAEMLYESLLVATQADQQTTDFRQAERLKNRWLQQFSTAFGNDEGEERTEFNGTITQTLMMFNGGMVQSATKTAGNGFLAKLIKNQKLSARKKIDLLFLAAFARKATRREYSAMKRVLTQSKTPNEGAQDIWWALLNSNEFLFQH